MKLSGWIAVMTLLAAGLGGCATTGSAETPTAEMVGLHVAQKTEFGVRLEIELLLENPGKVALPVTKAEYRVEIEDLGTFSFTDEPHRTIPAGGRQSIRLPAALATDDVSIAGKRFEVDGRLVYDPPGEFRRVLTEAKIPLPSVSFEGQGQLP